MENMKLNCRYRGIFRKNGNFFAFQIILKVSLHLFNVNKVNIYPSFNIIIQFKENILEEKLYN